MPRFPAAPIGTGARWRLDTPIASEDGQTLELVTAAEAEQGVR